MATTAFNSPRADALRPTAPGPTSGFAAHLAALRMNWRAHEEKRALARFAGTRWCDATEREILHALGESERGFVLS
jgi:hypothetical protein